MRSLPLPAAIAGGVQALARPLVRLLMSKRTFVALVAACLLLVGAATGAADHSGAGRFPSHDPGPRAGTPNDPDFDCAEPDDEDAGRRCSTVWEEQYNLFGFAPASTRATATYKDLPRAGQGQVSGISADRAWKMSIGRPAVPIAIIDTGIVWSRRELRTQVWLNGGELPRPLLADGTPAASHDANSDGAFNVDDYATDPGVDPNAGPNGIAGQLDGQDLLEAFSDGIDRDLNGYIDDIVGWDFFDNDNDPFDASSYSSAENHGSGRAEEAARQTDNGVAKAAVCPRCQVMMLRVWDSFIPPADHYAMATIYAADNGAAVQEVALGVLQNSRFSREATQYAFEKGVALMQVSSDLNSSNHNYPTNYNNTVYVAGTVADVHGIGEDFGQQSPQLTAFLSQLGIGTQAPVSTWFRNSNLTQFGGHAAIVTVGTTGSQATGQASGAAGLIVSRGLELAHHIGGRLTSNEVKQIITLTAEDVLPENTIGLGTPDPAQPGWDQHFGYGRADLGAALARVAPGSIPPEAGIESPSWFMPLDPVVTPTVPVSGFASTRSSAFTYELAYATGVEPLEDSFTTFKAGAGDGRMSDLGELPLAEIAQLLPGAAEGIPPFDPHQYAFTVRLRVRDADNPANFGEDRKTLFAYHDPTMHGGWPKFVDTGGESSLHFADLDGNGVQEIVAASSSGEIAVYNHDGTPAAYFNGGLPFRAAVPSFIQDHLAAPDFASGAIEPGRGGFSTPAIGDLDRDGYPEIVAANGERVYALRGDGSLLPGFPVAINPAFSAPALRTKNNHLKTGIFSSPVLADLDKDGRLDIVVAAMDQRAYVWNINGALLPGWPVLLKSGDAGAESINTPAVADINGDGFLDVVVASNELYGASRPGSLEEAIREGLINLANGLVGVSSRLYAVHHDGTAHDGDPSDDGGSSVDPDAFLAGWPVTLNGLADVFPLVGPGVDAVVADVDPTSPGPEVINGSFTGDWVVIGGNGQARYSLQNGAAAGNNLSPGTILNTAEHAAVGDFAGTGTLGIFKGGLPLIGAVNLLLVGQNFPFSHVVQGWEARTGQMLPTWPQKTDDFQFLSGPSIADVGGLPDREVLVGTGLYLLHAYGPTGLEPPGFPKFTGGWIFGTTPIADIDRDGKLEIANWTREGNLFVWDTAAPACGGNSEWWGFRHDDHNSGVYGNDTRAPAPVFDLAANSLASVTGGGTIAVESGKANFGFNVKYRNGAVDGQLLYDDHARGLRVKSEQVTTLLSARSLTLRWTAPGDDAACGRGSHYEIRTARSAITRANWEQAQLLARIPAGAPGSQESFRVPPLPEGTHFFAVRAVDEAGNIAPVSNSPSADVARVPADTAIFSGTATVNGDPGHRFRVTVRDLGEPGNGVDSFEISVEPDYAAAGMLEGGNIQIRPVADTQPTTEIMLLWRSLFPIEDVLFLLQ